MVGFTNFASLVGIMIGLFTAGPNSSNISAVLTKRNKGIWEPEMRLITMILYVLIVVSRQLRRGIRVSTFVGLQRKLRGVFLSFEFTNQKFTRFSSSLVSLAPAYRSLLS